MGELYSVGLLEAAMCMAYPKRNEWGSDAPYTLRKGPCGGAFAGKALWHQAWRQSELCWKVLVQVGHTQWDGGGLYESPFRDWHPGAFHLTCYSSLFVGKAPRDI